MVSRSTAKVTGTMCGRPSGETVASLATRAAASRSLASSGASRMVSAHQIQALARDQPVSDETRLMTSSRPRTRATLARSGLSLEPVSATLMSCDASMIEPG
jgi:hypothetical protein